MTSCPRGMLCLKPCYLPRHSLYWLKLVKQTSAVVTSESPCIPPVQTSAGFSAPQTTGPVTQVSSSPPLTGTSSVPVSGEKPMV